MKILQTMAVFPVVAASICLIGRSARLTATTGQQPAAASSAGSATGSEPRTKEQASAHASPTWSRDIAPVLYKNCASCHHPGGAGPFSLLTYADARRWGPQIVTVTQSRFMPPWLPEPGYGDFADVRRLSDDDRALIKQWLGEKMPQGDASAAPAPPHFDESWLMGKPDLVLKVARPYTLPAGGSDFFRNFVLPYPLKETHYIRALQILPGAPQVVHHANLTIDRNASMRRQHPADWQDGVPGMELSVDAGNSFDPDSHFLFWKPDTPALIEPEGMPWRLDPGNDLILNIHLKPSGKPETIDAEVGLYFTPDPPKERPMLIALERDDALDIPAGDPSFVIEDSLTLPVDVEVFGVYPHAHYLGHDLEGWAILPNGEKKWMIWIRNWDIDRQAVYRYKTPVFLPKGTVLHMRYTYDNSASNEHNPHSPPVRVRAGNRSEDEMGHLWFQVLPVNVPPGAADQRLQIEETWMRNRLSKTPNDQISLYNYAAALAGQGKYAEAGAAFERLLKLAPTDERTQTALGVALDGEGKWEQAIEAFRSTIQMHSKACDARFDLANVELRHDEVSSAEADFRAELAACPEDADVHAGLGAALASENQTDAAQAEFRRSLELAAGNLTALLGLAKMQLDAGQVEPAVELFKRAVSFNPESAEAHEELARAYAQTGDLKSALPELQRAVEVKPDDPQLHSALSQVLASMGSVSPAIEEQRIALKLYEDDADGWNNLGVLEARTGQILAAREDFEHALRLQPNHPQAKANLVRFQDRN
jgi:Flp pilus assembly protein TadD/mono/diheme cytochrome c family protein